MDELPWRKSEIADARNLEFEVMDLGRQLLAAKQFRLERK